MQFRLALSTAILGTITVAISSALTGQFAGYAKTSSYELSNIQNRTCPTITGENLTASELTEQTLNFASEPDTVMANRLLAISAFCNGYGGYGGVTQALPNAANLGATIPAESSTLLYIDKGSTSPTPQAEAELDQLPQDRVEFKAPI